MCVTVAGRELIEQRKFLDTCEVDWLAKLAEFDSTSGYEADGYPTCVTWLVGFCGMGRSTAKEKLRVAHELTRRPVIAAAFASGALSYQKARVLTRLIGLDTERDEEFVEHAQRDTADWLSRRVQRWNDLHDQDRPPKDRYERRGLWRSRGVLGGYGRVVIEGPDDELDRIQNMLTAYNNWQYWNANPDPAESVDKATAEPPRLRLVADDTHEHDGDCDHGVIPEAPIEYARSWSQRMYDALIDLLEEVALVNPEEVDPEQAAITVTVPYEMLVEGVQGTADLSSGATLTYEQTIRIACDAILSRMIVKGASEILDTGRKTRIWSVAQRRAIRALWGHKCAVKGCCRRIVQIHHIIFWENGGTTCVENGIPLCAYHHRLVHHAGWVIEWNYERGELRFIGPLGQVLESTVPIRLAA
jgi:hypothetical protein